MNAFVQVALLPRLLKCAGTDRTVMVGLLLGMITRICFGLSVQAWMVFTVTPGVAAPA